MQTNEALKENILNDPFGKWWGSLTQQERNVMWSDLQNITKAFYAGRASHLQPEAGTLNESMLRIFGTILDSQLGEWGSYEWDGAECEDVLIKLGLIEQVKVTEPCGEDCYCASVSDFPTDCNKVTDLGRKALALAAAPGSERK